MWRVFVINIELCKKDISILRNVQMRGGAEHNMIRSSLCKREPNIANDGTCPVALQEESNDRQRRRDSREWPSHRHRHPAEGVVLSVISAERENERTTSLA